MNRRRRESDRLIDTMGDAAAGNGVDGGSAETAEVALGEVWDLLDLLPVADAPASLTASTIEMAVISADVPRTAAAGLSAGRRWLAAGSIVAACLALGTLVGSATLPQPSENVRDYAVVKQLDLLRKLGSIEFLERFGQLIESFPRLPGGRRPNPQLEAAVLDFSLFGGSSTEAAQAVERDRDGWDADARRAFRDAQSDFSKLSSPRKRELRMLTEALAEATDGELITAANRWLALLDRLDPLERAGLVDLDADARLEWIDRRIERLRRFNNLRQRPLPGPSERRAPRG